MLKVVTLVLKNKRIVRISPAIDNYDCIIKKQFDDETNEIKLHIVNLK